MPRHRVLVVEDEAAVRKVIALALTRDPDLEVRTCASGHDALAEAAGWSPDLILLDVMMPGLDGPTTLARLRADPATAQIPVMFLTARARPAELSHFISLGALGAIAKPFVPHELRTTVKGLLHTAPGGSAAVDQRPAASPPRSDSRGVAGPLMSTAAPGAGRKDYLALLRTTAALLVELRAALRERPASRAVLDDLRTVVHRTAGSAGLYGLEAVSTAATQLEDTIIAWRAGKSTHAHTDAGIEALVSLIGREQTPQAD
jgi:CheY-like chemotaxis protein